MFSSCRSLGSHDFEVIFDERCEWEKTKAGVKNHVSSNRSSNATSKRKVVMSTAQIPRRPSRETLSTTKPILESSIFPCDRIHLCNLRAPRTNSESKLKFILNGRWGAWSEALGGNSTRLATECPNTAIYQEKCHSHQSPRLQRETTSISGANRCRRGEAGKFKVGRRRGSPKAKLEATSPRFPFA